MVRDYLEGVVAQKSWRHYVMGLAAVVVSVAYCAFFSPTDMLGRQWLATSNVSFNIAYFPVLILGGLFGYVYSMFFCLILLVVYMVQDMSTAYYAFLYVAISGLTYIMAKKQWFIHPWKTLLACGICSLMIGNGGFLLICISYPQGFVYYSLLGQLFIFISALPECLLVFYGLFFFYRLAPDHIKENFYCGFFYTWRYQRYVLIKQKYHGLHSMSGHVTIALFIDLFVIVIMAGVISYTLLTSFLVITIPEQTTIEDNGNLFISDLHFMVLLEQNNADIRKVSGNVPIGLGLLTNKDNIVVNSFIIEMILMMWAALLPVIALSNFAAQKFAVDPIRHLSEFIDGYVNTPEEKRSHYVEVTPFRAPFFSDELWDVHRAIRVLVNDVDAYVAKLQEQQKLEDNLRSAREASKAKSNFLSNISHEIRTPINAVLGMDEMILRESHEPATLEYAKDIQNAGKTLLSLINDVLDFSKIEAGKMEIIPVEYNLTSTINDLYNMVMFRAKEKNIHLIFDFDPDMPHLLYGDEIRIKQCIMNILNNSVKYTESGSVSLRVTFDRSNQKEVYINVSIEDTGVGIRKEDMDKLFAPFQRIDERNNLTIEGTGLGMSIVRNLLHEMGSDLYVESEYGKGSKFYFRILQGVVSWEPIGDFTRFYREMNEHREKLYETFHAPDARILVVDDTQMNLAVVQGLLKPTQIQIDTALSGTGALVMLEKQQYDVIFIDYRMPNMDGKELLHRIRELEDNANSTAPCIVLTANAISGAREEYLAAGFDDYLSKPVNGQLLEQMLERHLPPEKLIYEGMEGYGDNAPDDSALEIENQIRSALSEAKMLDVDKALEFCDNAVVLKDALEEFYLAIDSKADAIEGYARDMDFQNYTVLVHALKGGARLIGALQLSSYAAYMEECGDNEREDKIRELTPELLRQYRELKKLLAPIAERNEDNLPIIDEEQLQQAWEDLKELIEVYDFTSADRIMEMLKAYRIPAPQQEKYEKVRELMAAVDRDQLLTIL